MRKNRKFAAINAINAAGGATVLAGELNELLDPETPIKATRVQKWKVTGIPPHFVIPVEKITQVSRHKLHPELYPDAA